MFVCPEVNGYVSCPVPAAPTPSPAQEPEDRLWSDAATWIELGHDGLPAFPNPKDETVTIPAGWT
eukprot:scaffold660391_cov57-Prasinocladus_malaysianus.AAC.1